MPAKHISDMCIDGALVLLEEYSQRLVQSHFLCSGTGQLHRIKEEAIARLHTDLVLHRAVTAERVATPE